MENTHNKIIALDIGSSNIKSCLFESNDSIKLLYSKTINIGLYSPKPFYAEHNPEEVWQSVCFAIKDIFNNTHITNDEVSALSICSQAQCVMLVDKDGNALTPIYNSQDARAIDTYYKYYSKGLITYSGVNVFKALKCYLSSGFMPGSAKDPVFKYKWAEDNLPEIYKKAYKWLDIKDYIIYRLTGKFVTTKDNAHAYTIYNSKENKGHWSKPICKLFKIDMNKLPEVKESTDVIGSVSEEISKQTGLSKDTLILGGVIDSSAVQYGSGATDVGDMMIYWGTSGWVGTVTDKLKVDLAAKVGALIAAEDHKFHYYAMLDSAGISYNWLKDHIISDDGLLNKEIASNNDIYTNMNDVISKVKPGCDGLMYAPWLTGVRAPMEASNIGGMFLNFKINMSKKHIVRAVVEGICYHYRLLMEVGKKNVGVPNVVRFVGGGAKSNEIGQILADITGCVIEVPNDPQDAGALGAAIVGFYALNKDSVSLSDVAKKQTVEKRFFPNLKNRKIYDRYYKVYKKLYNKNHKILSKLTEISESVDN